MRITQQIPTRDERKIWGRCVGSYSGAWGTGGVTDPEAGQTGIDGHLDFATYFEEFEVRDVLARYPLDASSPDSILRLLPDYSERILHMKGYKFAPGWFRHSTWVGLLKFLFSRDGQAGVNSVKVGVISAQSIVGLFDRFDAWRDGEYQSSPTLEESIRRANDF